MRRPQLAFSLSAAALGIALSATGGPAQTSAPAPAAGALPSAASVNPARGARHLLRNGQDYLDLGEPDRALELLREAETRQAELVPAEREKLALAIQRARAMLRDPVGNTLGRPRLAAGARRGTARSSGAVALAPSPAAPTRSIPLPGEPARLADIGADRLAAPASVPSTLPPLPATATVASAPALAPTPAAPEPFAPLSRPAPATDPAATLTSANVSEPPSGVPAELPPMESVEQPAGPDRVASAAPEPLPAVDPATMPAAGETLPRAEPIAAPAETEAPVLVSTPRTNEPAPAEAESTSTSASTEPRPGPVLLMEEPPALATEPAPPAVEPAAAMEPAPVPAATAVTPDIPLSGGSQPGVLTLTPAGADDAPQSAEPLPAPAEPPSPPATAAPEPVALPPLPGGEPADAPAAPPAPPEALPGESPSAIPSLGVQSGDPLAPDLPKLPGEPAPTQAPTPEPAPAVEPAPAALESVPAVAPDLPPLPADAPPPATLDAPPSLMESEPTPATAPATDSAPPAMMAERPADAPVEAPPTDTPPPPPAAEEILGEAPPAAPATDDGMALPPLPGDGQGQGEGDAPSPLHTVTQGLPSTGLTLPAELRREVEQIARRQQEEMQQELQANPSLIPGLGDQPDSLGAYGPPPGSLVESSQGQTRIDLPRPPSPTEPFPIRAIPVPEEFVPLQPRNWTPSQKVWAAAATCHGPLYFQDPVLERYGQGVEQALGPRWGRLASYPLDDPTQSVQRQQILQPVYSIGKFAAQIALWPYNLVVNPPGEAEYDLGYYRPGDRIPPDTMYWPWHGYGPPLQGKDY